MGGGRVNLITVVTATVRPRILVYENFSQDYCTYQHTPIMVAVLCIFR